MNQPEHRSNQKVVGIDWGTTNRRTYLFDANGNVVRQHNDGMGILAVKDFKASLHSLLTELEIDEADIIMSGMVGSRNGWKEVPYLTVEHSILHLPEALVEIESGLPNVRCRIVPGYQFTDRHGFPDVMRGEETQVMGALALEGTEDGWFVLPGTHSKWVAVENGIVTELITFMTGELYALLSKHGTLSNLMQDQEDAPQAFHAGLSAACDAGFTHMAFACRAMVVTGAMPARHTAAFLSGLLIGAELHEISRRINTSAIGEQIAVQVIASETLAPRYRSALEYFGMSARLWQPDEIFAGAIRRLAGLKKGLEEHHV